MFEGATDNKFVAKSLVEEICKKKCRCSMVLGGELESDNFVANACARSLKEFMKRTRSLQKDVSVSDRKEQLRASHFLGVSEKHCFLTKSFGEE